MSLSLSYFFIFDVVDHLELREISTSRFGLSSSLYAVCDDCGLSEFLATGDHNPSDNAPRTVQGKDLNRRVVYAAIEMGIGREDVSKFCEILNMPFSLSKDTWHSHEDALLQAHTEVVQVELEKNRREARKLAVTEEGISAGDEDTVVNIPVSFDGTWSRRGYTANHGIGFVISAATGKVLDYEVISKVCNTCIQKKSSLNEHDFEQWAENHTCLGSFGGSSASMEMESAKRLWGRSQDYSIRYKFMISDGDSKSYSAIWNYYGACDTCNQYESLESTSEEYKTWKASEDYVKWENEHLDGSVDCNRVIKLDCIGHVQKRLGKALYEFQRTALKLEDGKPVKGRQGRLTKTAIEKMKRSYGKAIRNNVNKDINSVEERDAAVQVMQTEIMAGLYHSLKLPNKERHKYCPNNSWCRYKKKIPCPDKPHHLDPVFEKYLHPIYERLSDPALLSRCLPGFTQNANESINSLVWIRCPKHKWHGRKRILLATASATLQFSAGATAKHEVMARAGLAVGGHTRKESTRRDSERIKKAEKRIQDQHKKYRVARRQAKQRDEEQRRQKEGTTYSAGAFNELTVTTAPAKKRKKK